MTVAIIAGFAFIVAGLTAVGKGLVLGTLFGVVNFVLMGELMSKGENRRRFTTLHSLVSLGFRYLLLAIPLYIGIKYESFDFAAVVVGVFMIQIIILAEELKKLLISRLRQDD